MTYGPVITAIDAGHYINSQTGNCRKCKTRFPCFEMEAAVAAQRPYAEWLAQQQRTAIDTTRVMR